MRDGLNPIRFGPSGPGHAGVPSRRAGPAFGGPYCPWPEQSKQRNLCPDKGSQRLARRPAAGGRQAAGISSAGRGLIAKSPAPPPHCLRQGEGGVAHYIFYLIIYEKRMAFTGLIRRTSRAGSWNERKQMMMQARLIPSTSHALSSMGA